MKQKRGFSIDLLLALLAVCFVALDIVLAFTNLMGFIIAMAATLVVALIFFFRAQRLRRLLARLLTGQGPGISPAQHSLLGAMETPVVITDSLGSVLWYNDAFRAAFELKNDIYLEDISSVIPGFDATVCLTELGNGYFAGERHYMVFSTGFVHGVETTYTSILLNDTAQYREAERYRLTRTSVLMFRIDNLDEYGGGTETENAEVLAEVYRAMEDFINSTNGIHVRVSGRNFVAIIEEQHMAEILEKRFPILDTVRGIGTKKAPVTMSIGVGRGAKTLYENYLQARHALDMALGRGGDQAAMKTRTGYEFYGGAHKAVEKRSKVKSRVMANAMLELMQSAGRVLVMGHKNSDLDSLGACVGIARAAHIAGAEARIVLNQNATLAHPLLEKLKEAGYGGLFLEPGKATDLVQPDTLLVVVDCHLPRLVESEELLKACANVMLIDHHRRMVGYIDNTVLTYHEPYASSCCELVAELLQNIDSSDDTLTKLEAESMLAGMMLDTKNFTVRAGVRTFEAAAYLRRLGADPTDAKLLFATDMDSYRHRANLVAAAQVYRGCAVVVTDQLPEKMRVVIPQTADELLSIEGISASIVAVKFQNRIHISSRSLGAYNVQLIMEHLGGGGHSTTAGVQLDEADLGTVSQLIRQAVDRYLDDNAVSEASV